MTATELKKKLEDEFLGKKYDSYSTLIRAAYFAQEALVAELGQEYFYLISSKKQQPQTSVILYKGYFLFELRIKKKKTATHHSWHGSYCDWEIAGIEVSEFDLAWKLAEIDKLADARKEAESKIYFECVEIYKKIQEMFPGETQGKTEERISQLYQRKYAIGAALAKGPTPEK